jgi:hypothetical protein
MDHLPAQATFVEITFAVNLLFAAYSTFRDYLKKHLAEKVEEYEATIKIIEMKPGNLDRLNIVNAKVSEYATKFVNAQQICVCWATAFSLIAAACCVTVVFWDWLTVLGHHTGWLFLPLPAYFLASACNYGNFRRRAARKLRRFRKAIAEFETPPKIPPELGGP